MSFKRNKWQKSTHFSLLCDIKLCSSESSASVQTGTAITSPCLTTLLPFACALSSKKALKASVNCLSYFLFTLVGLASLASVILFATGNGGSRCPDGTGKRRIDGCRGDFDEDARESMLWRRDGGRNIGCGGLEKYILAKGMVVHGDRALTDYPRIPHQSLQLRPLALVSRKYRSLHCN